MEFTLYFTLIMRYNNTIIDNDWSIGGKMMKKISLAVFAMMMVAMLAVFAGCGSSSNTNGGTADSGTCLLYTSR